MKRLVKIIVATDLSDHSRRAIEYAGALAVDDKAALIIMHVANEFAAWEFHYDGFGYSEQWPLERVLSEAALDLNRYLEPHLGLLREVPILIKRIVLGAIAGQIITVAEEEKADLIVLSPRRQRSWRWPFSAGITEKVTRMSPCPVLLVAPALPSKQWRGKFLPLSFEWPPPSAESV
jgi:nucleotide-binding universal stress UspA family protein